MNQMFFTPSHHIYHFDMTIYIFFVSLLFGIVFVITFAFLVKALREKQRWRW